MKIFQVYQQFIAYFIVRDEVRKIKPLSSVDMKSFQHNNISWKNAAVYFEMTLASGLFIVYINQCAKTFQEFSETIYAITTLNAGIFAMIIFELNKENIFELIDSLEVTINDRKLLKCMDYNKKNSFSS